LEAVGANVRTLRYINQAAACHLGPKEATNSDAAMFAPFVDVDR
jgi:hypothetical protein